MKQELKYLDELSPNTPSYKVKVKVIEKGRARTSPKKGTVYQSILLQDDKGHKMRGALFGDQVDSFKDAIVYNGVYEIANAPIKPCTDQWKAAPGELDYQMSFGRQTIIQPVEATLGTMIYEYTCISNIPRAVNADEKIDMLGIVLYVDDKAKKIVTRNGYDSLVREVVITDHSAEMPLVISAWNDLSGAECDSLVPETQRFHIVGFTALKVSNHKGFSMATTMSTSIIHKPEGQKAKDLEDWAARHLGALENRRKRVIDARSPSSGRQIINVYALKLKKAADTMPEERCWLRVQIPGATLDKVYAYVGCSKCGRSAGVPLDTIYVCDACKRKECTALARVTFSCELMDNTGSLVVTMFTDACEQLFRMTAPDIFRMKFTDDQGTFARIRQSLESSFILVEVGPTLALARNSILQWVPKQLDTTDLVTSSTPVSTCTLPVNTAANPEPIATAAEAVSNATSALSDNPANAPIVFAAVKRKTTVSSKGNVSNKEQPISAGTKVAKRTKKASIQAILQECSNPVKQSDDDFPGEPDQGSQCL